MTTRAWHITSLGQFDRTAALADLAARSAVSGFASTSNLQLASWEGTLRLLEAEIRTLTGSHPEAADWRLLLECEIPRRQRRIDVVLIAGSVVVVVEVKHGTERFDRAAVWQAEDYALELRDFHGPSRGRAIVPILWATGSTSAPRTVRGAAMGVACSGRSSLAAVILERVRSAERASDSTIDAGAWDSGEYRPTPTIIDATQRLFAGHGVADISHAYADNLDATVRAIGNEVERAQAEGLRTICFVTGVPGAGKTLSGLAAAHAAQQTSLGEANAAYLSGNGPLVLVLREALARDGARQGTTLKKARKGASTLIQNVHEFVREYAIAKPSAAPREHVVVFDEAQRAWHSTQMSKRHPSLDRSEPALMLDIMSRAPDWSVIVALIGGGQEIHTGEAGLEEWGRAIASAGGPWRVVASPEVLSGGSSVGAHRLFAETPGGVNVHADASMHLDVSVRSPRARHLAEWVNAVLDLRAEDAARAISQIDGFRIGMTRDLEAAKDWLRDATRGESRCGLLSSSGNLRLRAYGHEVAPEFLKSCALDRWFLDPATDVRSSSALEIVMTEFKVQGLELDLAGLCWGDDLTIAPDGSWDMRRFSGARWQAINDEWRRRYLLNKHRVLLTRAREGMVVFVPRGDANDPTREPARLDRTAEYLQVCGLIEVS